MFTPKMFVYTEEFTSTKVIKKARCCAVWHMAVGTLRQEKCLKVQVKTILGKMEKYFIQKKS